MTLRIPTNECTPEFEEKRVILLPGQIAIGAYIIGGSPGPRSVSDDVAPADTNGFAQSRVDFDPINRPHPIRLAGGWNYTTGMRSRF